MNSVVENCAADHHGDVRRATSTYACRSHLERVLACLIVPRAHHSSAGYRLNRFGCEVENKIL